MSPILNFNGDLNFTTPTTPTIAGSGPTSTSSILSNQIVTIAIPSLLVVLGAWLGRSILKRIGSMLSKWCKKWWAARGPLTDTAVSDNQSYVIETVILSGTSSTPAVRAPVPAHVTYAPSRLDYQPSVQLRRTSVIRRQYCRHGTVLHAEHKHHNKLRDEEGGKESLNERGDVEEDIGDAADFGNTGDLEETNTQENDTENDSEEDLLDDAVN